MGVIKAGVIGYPIDHSLSPKLHSLWLEKHNIKGTYEKIAIKPENLETSIKKLRDNGYSGFNVTIPHKENIIEFMDSIDNNANKIGAVNTVVIDEKGKFHGSNTDGYGFIQNLYTTVPSFDLTGRVALVLGAGGATRAVINALVSEGVSKIYLLNRTVEKAENLAKIFKTKTCDISPLAWEDNMKAFSESTLVVNTTSLGMTGGDDMNLNIIPFLPSDSVVYDLVYSPLYTDILTKANNKNIVTVTGIGMLVYQAVPGFELWFGVKPEFKLEQFCNALLT